MTEFLHASKLAFVGFLISCGCLFPLFFVIDPLFSISLASIGLVIGLYCKFKYKENSYAVWFSIIVGFFIYAMIIYVLFIAN